MSPLDSQSQHKLISKEIQRHLEDAEISKLSHFHAAARLDNLHKYYLGLPTAISALVLSCLITQKDIPSESSAIIYYLKISLGMFVTVATGVVAFLNFNEMAAKHRTAAQKYQAVWRRCKNWSTDFPDENDIKLAREKAQAYREEMTEINSQSPQIPKWAYKSVRKQQKKGSTSYKTDKPT